MNNKQQSVPVFSCKNLNLTNAFVFWTCHVVFGSPDPVVGSSQSCTLQTDPKSKFDSRLFHSFKQAASS